jgi:hypothetical protein
MTENYNVDTCTNTDVDSIQLYPILLEFLLCHWRPHSWSVIHFHSNSIQLSTISIDSGNKSIWHSFAVSSALLCTVRTSIRSKVTCSLVCCCGALWHVRTHSDSRGPVALFEFKDIIHLRLSPSLSHLLPPLALSTTFRHIQCDF